MPLPLPRPQLITQKKTIQSAANDLIPRCYWLSASILGVMSAETARIFQAVHAQSITLKSRAAGVQSGHHPQGGDPTKLKTVALRAEAIL